MFRVVFAGMVCFFKENGARIALLPDALGEDPPHVTRIAVSQPASEILGSSSNWGDLQQPNGDFFIRERSVITFENSAVADPQHPLQVLVPQPPRLPTGFTIDLTTAQTIAQIPLRRGTLQSFRYPGSNPGEHVSIITHYELPHSGTIHVTVTSNAGATVRTIELAAGTEIAIVNDTTDEGKPHYHLYGKLGTGATIPPNAPPIANFHDYHRSSSQHRVFSGTTPIVGGVDCPNTGCC